MSWKLTKDTNIVTLPDPAADYEAWIEKSQRLGWTAAGAARAYDKDVTAYRARVTWKDLTDSEKAGLATFFGNTTSDTPPGVDGVMATFTLTDHASNTYTARFLQPELRFTKVLNNRWHVTVELVLDALPA